MHNGITDILIVTGPGQRQPGGPLRPVVRAGVPPRAEGQARRARPDARHRRTWPRIHYVRQGEPLGLGHAVSMAEDHVGDEPFVVLLGDDIMQPAVGDPGRHAGRPRAPPGQQSWPSSTSARAEISSYGSVAAEPVDGGVPGPGARPGREADAGGGAIRPRRHGPLRAHPGHLRRPRPAPSRAAAARSSSPMPSKLLLDTEPVYGYTFERRPLRRRQQARLPAGHRGAGPRATRSRPALPRLPRGTVAAGRDPPPRRPGRGGRRLPTQSGPPDRSSDDALGLVLAEPVTAAENVPPFANTAMDGYAVRAADTAGAGADRPARLKVIGTLAAGQAPGAPVGPGEALRIMTGAPFPDGADAVAIVENTRSEGDQVWVSAPAAAGEHVRRAGEDWSPDRRSSRPGPSSAPATSACCPVSGWEKVPAVPAPVVGVLSTGDELVEGGGALLPGQIRDSNRRTLMALLRRDGFAAVDLGHRPRRRRRDRGPAPRRGGPLRRRADQRRGQHGRLRPGQGGPRPHRRRCTGCRSPSARPSRSPSGWWATRRCSGCPATRFRRW